MNPRISKKNNKIDPNNNIRVWFLILEDHTIR
jgi:hypothetical protein